MKFIKNVILIVLIILLTVSAIKIYDGYELYKSAIEAISLEDKVTEIKSKKNYTTIDEMPEIYLKAVVAVEDHRFYVHKGVDIISIGRAIWTNITSMSLAEGGSTITQQLAKNAYFTQERKITRKIAEIFMAIEFEKNYTKDEILEFYLNTSYFGEGCYTVKEASKVYFEKEPIYMTDYESTMLAGIPNAPSVYAPTVNPQLAKERQMQVINKMIAFNVLTKEEAEEILASGEAGEA